MRTIRWVALALCLAVPAVADEGSAQDFMKGRQTELASLVRKSDGQKKIATIFDSILDYDAFAQASLKDHWTERSDAERKQFQDLLKQLIQRAYRKNLDRTADYDVRYDGEAREGEGVTVHTVAQSRSNAREEPVSIDYVLHRTAGVWKIQDIVTEGSSLVNNYRQQFNRIIKKDGFPELLNRMKKRLATHSDEEGPHH
jgi:phospholipid transport system substrate-binding protein